jgi:hypothetical protein
MGKVYIAQDNLVLYVNTGTNLSEAGNVVIEGTDPNGSSITPLVTVIEDIITGLVTYEVSNVDFTVAGTYVLWAKVNYIGGTSSWGEPFHFNVYETGN